MEKQKEVPGWVGGCVGSVMAFVFLGMGLFILLTALNIIPSAEENYLAPRPVVAAAGLVFFLAGFLLFIGSIFSAEELRLPIMLWIQFLFVVTAMAAFSGIFLWVGLGPGEREFQSSTTFGSVTTRGTADDITGRILFGSVGVLCSLGTVLYACVQIVNLINGKFKSIFDQNHRIN